MPDSPGNPASEEHRLVAENFSELLEEAREQREFRDHLEQAIRAAMPQQPTPPLPAQPPIPQPTPQSVPPSPPMPAQPPMPAHPHDESKLFEAYQAEKAREKTPPSKPPSGTAGMPLPSPDDEDEQFQMYLDEGREQQGNYPAPPPFTPQPTPPLTPNDESKLFEAHQKEKEREKTPTPTPQPQPQPQPQPTPTNYLGASSTQPSSYGRGMTGDASVSGFSGPMTPMEFARAREQFGPVIDQLRQQGVIQVQAPLTAEQLRRQALEKRYGSEQADALILERERQNRLREAERNYATGQKLEAQRQRALKEQAREGPFPELADELTKRQNALRDYYRQKGTSPEDLAAKALQRQVSEQEKYVRNKFANLSPEERQAAMPQMSAIEQQRRKIEEEGLKRQREINYALDASSRHHREAAKGLELFTRALSGGAHGGAVGALTNVVAALGPGGMAVGALLTAATAGYAKIEQYQKEGAYGLHPGLERTRRGSEMLENMMIARRTKRDELERAIAAEQQANAAVQRERARQGQLAGQDPVIGRPRQAWNEMRLRQHEAELRRLGVLGPNERFKPKENIDLPSQPGFTSSLGYQSELQVGALQRNDLDNQISQEQLQELRKMATLLEQIQRVNSNGLEDLHLWGP